jgi:hypothetical protein
MYSVRTIKYRSAHPAHRFDVKSDDVGTYSVQLSLGPIRVEDSSAPNSAEDASSYYTLERNV